MYPELVHLGSFTIRTYSVVTELGIIVGVIAAYKAARRQGIGADTFIDMALYAVIAGIVGSRLYYVAIAWEQERFYADPLRIVASWEGGLVFQGAILGAVLALLVFVRRHHLPLLLVLDIGAVGIVLGHAIGRWACFFGGCCYGKPTTLPWGVQFPFLDEPVHPTMIYESFANLIIFAVLWNVDKRKPYRGLTFALYLIMYSTVRFLDEFLRGDPAEVIAGLRLAQWVCLGTIVAGGLVLLYARRGRQEAPVAAVEQQAARSQPQP